MDRVVSPELRPEVARTGLFRRRRSHADTQQRRAEKAQTLVLMGDVSAGRHALDDAFFCPRDIRNFAAFLASSASSQGGGAPRIVTSENTFILDHNFLTKNLKAARWETAGGPSGMTAEHLKTLLDRFRNKSCEHLLQSKIPRGHA